MQRILNWFRAWYSARQQFSDCRAHLRALDTRIAKAEAERDSALAGLRAAEQRLSALQETLTKEASHWQAVLDDASAAVATVSRELSATREDLRIANDVVIPSLVAAHKLVLQRSEADIASQVLRSVRMSPEQGQ